MTRRQGGLWDAKKVPAPTVRAPTKRTVESRKTRIHGSRVEFIRGFFGSPEYQVRRFDILGVALAVVKTDGRYFLVNQEGAIDDAIAKRITWKREDRGDRKFRLAKYLAKGWFESSVQTAVSDSVVRTEIQFMDSKRATRLKTLLDELPSGAYIAGGAVASLFDGSPDE